MNGRTNQRCQLWLGLVGIWLAISALGCQKAYYSTMEQFGYHKREIMVDRVKDAQEAQKDAKKQFQSALERFSALTNFSGGNLEKKYNKLKGELETSENKAESVSDHIEAVEDVAKALFSEWEAELDQYSNPKLRQSSQRQLDQTRQHYKPLIRAMKKAESKMEPVLATFRDQVLYLKHNLNAKAIASLQEDLALVEADIGALISEMELSIAEADAFIATLDEH